jgi:hypothetical protein
LDWSFATVDGAIAAAMSSDLMVAPPTDVVEAFVRESIQKGPDGRFRFRFSPGAVVVAWSEMTLPPPEIAPVPTLLLSAAKPLADSERRDSRYAELLGDRQSRVQVPHGHNVLWEAPEETITAVGEFVNRLT